MAKPSARGACICEPPGTGVQPRQKQTTTRPLARCRHRTRRAPGGTVGGAGARCRSSRQAVGAADHRRKLARASERVRPWPHVTTPAGMGCAARWGRCVNGAKFYIKLTSPADLVWKGGPTVFRCDGAFARRHKVPGAVKRRPPFPQHGTQIRDWVPPWLGDF